MKNQKESSPRSNIPPEYEKILADPIKTAGLVAENMKQIGFLEKARARVLGAEIYEENKIKKTPAGKVWDEQEKDMITSEISRFDQKLAELIKGQKNKRKIVRKIDKRVKKIRKENKKFEGKIEDLRAKNIATMGKGGKLAKDMLGEIAEIARLSREGAAISDENKKIRDEIRKSIESKSVEAENFDRFVSLFKSMDANTKKYLELRKKVDIGVAKLNIMKEKATRIEEEFVNETKEIRRRKAA